jgi:hypothetical protein
MSQINFTPIIQQLAVLILIGIALYHAYRKGKSRHAAWKIRQAEDRAAAGEVKAVKELMDTGNKLQEGQIKATLALVTAVEEMRKLIREFAHMILPPKEVEAEALQVTTDEDASILYATMALMSTGLSEDEARARATAEYDKRVATGGAV